MEGPCKGNAALESHEQGRVAERCQTAADVGDEKDKEYDDVDFFLPPGVGLDDRTDEEHGRAGRADPAGQDRADEQEQGIDFRSTCQRALDGDAAGDDEQAEEQDDKGNVIDQDRFEETEQSLAHAVGDGKGNEEDQRPADSHGKHIFFPPMGLDEGANGDGQEHADVGNNTPGRQGSADDGMSAAFTGKRCRYGYQAEQQRKA